MQRGAISPCTIEKFTANCRKGTLTINESWHLESYSTRKVYSEVYAVCFNQDVVRQEVMYTPGVCFQIIGNLQSLSIKHPHAFCCWRCYIGCSKDSHLGIIVVTAVSCVAVYIGVSI